MRWAAVRQRTKRLPHGVRREEDACVKALPLKREVDDSPHTHLHLTSEGTGVPGTGPTRALVMLAGHCPEQNPSENSPSGPAPNPWDHLQPLLPLLWCRRGQQKRLTSASTTLGIHQLLARNNGLIQLRPQVTAGKPHILSKSGPSKEDKVHPKVGRLKYQAPRQAGMNAFGLSHTSWKTSP